MIAINKNPMKNSEGYSDPTAYLGTATVIREETEAERRNRTIIQTFRRIADLAGFEIVGRIELMDKKTGRYFR